LASVARRGGVLVESVFVVMPSELAGTFFADAASMQGKVAVITGAGNGIGLEVARRCAKDFGMKVVLADIDGETLERHARELGGIAVVTDVRKRDDVERLLSASQGASADGCIDFLLLNAGVGGDGVTILNGSREADWRWVFDVNFFGVVHGLQVFVPALLKQVRPCLVSATASSQGLDIGGPPVSTASYAASKHAVMAIMESLEGELAFRKGLGQIQVSVLCPGLVASNIWDLSRQERLRGDGQARETISAPGRTERLKAFFGHGTSVASCVQTYLEDVARGDFICDSVRGYARETFARRAAYIEGGLLPGDRRLKLSKL